MKTGNSYHPKFSKPILAIFITLTLLVSSFQLSAQKHPLRLFLIGNSFSQNASRYLTEISESAGEEIVIGRAELPGCPLSRHWESVLANDANPADPKGKPYGGKSLPELLSSGDWDVITLQQYSLLSGDSSTYQPYAFNLYQLIKRLQPNAEVVIHQTWAYRSDARSFGKIKGEVRARNQREMWQASRSAYQHLGRTLSLRIIPSGDGFYQVSTDARLAYQKDENFDATKALYPHLPEQQHSLHVGYFYDRNHKLTFDPNHANDAGCYLAGLVWYRFLFKGDPTKISFKPASVDQDFAAALRKAARKSSLFR